MKTIKIGTRESKLAVIQAEVAAAYIRSIGLEAELVKMKTTGDRILDKTLSKAGGKGLFVKELDCALLEGRSDISVHSLKDMPIEMDENLPLLGFSKREDARDVLVLPKGAEKLDTRLPLGSSSARRAIQVPGLFPGMQVKSIRGNVLTRLEKLDQGEYSGLILAAAGLKRLGLLERISRYLEPEEMIPAAGQGILAVQGRAGEDYEWLDGLFDHDSRVYALAERSFVRALNGGCSAPIGAYAARKGDTLKLTGLYAKDGSECYAVDSIIGAAADAEELGKELAERIRKDNRI